MGERRTNAKAPDAASCASKLKVLADPTRLGVMEALFQGSRCVAELGAVLHVEQSLLSHHLRVLRDAGLVQARREGKQVRYTLAATTGAPSGPHSIHLGCCDLAFTAPNALPPDPDPT